MTFTNRRPAAPFSWLLAGSGAGRRRFFFALALPMACLLGVMPGAAAAKTNRPPVLCPDIHGAEEGSPMDGYYLGRSYDEGFCGLVVSKVDALHWYEQAGAQGHVLAQYEAAETYLHGDGIEADEAKAIQWYEAAALQGHGLSQLRLGLLYSQGRDARPADPSQAENWLSQAAAQDAGDATYQLGRFYLYNRQPADPAKALIWLKRAADGGHRQAMYELSGLLFSGAAGAANPALGMEWLTKAAESGFVDAQQRLAEIYRDGTHAAKNPTAAMTWMLRIAGQPGASARHLNQVADAFFEGFQELPKNYPSARKFYERASALGDIHAKQRLAQMYRAGLGVPIDEKMAEKLELEAQKASSAAP